MHRRTQSKVEGGLNVTGMIESLKKCAHARVRGGRCVGQERQAGRMPLLILLVGFRRAVIKPTGKNQLRVEVTCC